MLITLFTLLTRIMHLILGIGTPQKFPSPLSKEEEEECCRLSAGGDEEARQKLILHNLRLVSHIVRKYYSGAANQEDLISIGTIGLVKAVDAFRTSNGARFATYGAKCIQNEILMFFRSAKKNEYEVSINETIDIDKDGNPLTYLDIISVDESMAETIELEGHMERVRRLTETVLSGREKEIIILRYGLMGYVPKTQREVAKHLGISRSYVSRIEKKALQKLKRAFGKDVPSFDF